MKKISILPSSILFGAILLCFFGTVCSAETLEENMNGLLAKRQRYETYLTEAYFNNNKSETNVDIQSGNFSFMQTDYSLPGRNGLDLSITRLYKSGMSPSYEPYAAYSGGTWVNAMQAQWKSDNFLSFYEERYNLGAGTRFSFPTIEVVKNSSDNTYFKYLHSESGAVYRLVGPKSVNGVNEYRLEGYQLDDITVREATASDLADLPAYTTNSVVNTPKYVLVDKNGTRTFFSDKDSSGTNPEKYEGRILAVIDRYGSKIKFEYSIFSYTVNNSSYTTAEKTKTRKLITKIIDTVNREVIIVYDEYTNNQGQNHHIIFNNGSPTNDLQNKFNVKITTPDNQMIVYKKVCAMYTGATNQSIRERIESIHKLANAAAYTSSNIGDDTYSYGYESAQYNFNFSGTSYSPIPIIFDGSSSTSYIYNTWNNINKIYYPGYKRKEITYTDGTKKLGSNGAQTYRKVLVESDKLLSEDVRKLSYTYDGEPEGYASGNTIYPLIDFEGANDLSAFFTNNSNWSRSATAASDGGYGMISSPTSGVLTSTIRLYVNLDKPGLLSFDSKIVGTGTIALKVFKDNVAEMLSPAEAINNGWGRIEMPLPKGSYNLDFQAQKTGSSNAQICVDNISIGKYYGTTVTDDLSETNVKTTYVYNPRHILKKVYQDGDNHVSVEYRDYDFRNMLKKRETVLYDKVNGVSVDAPIYNVERYVYDNFGNLTEYIDPVDANIKYLYSYYGANKFHKLQSRTVQQGVSTVLSQTLYDVNSVGNTMKETRKHTENSVVKDAITDFDYDAKGNMVLKETYTYGDSLNIFRTHYEYGAIGSYSAGMLYLTRVYSGDTLSPISEKRYVYDFNKGLMTDEIEYANTQNTALTTSYGYDYKYRLTSITYPDSSTQNYYYYENGYQSSYNFGIRIYGQNTDIVYTYDILGNLLSTQKYGQTALLSSYRYDSRGNVIRETDGKGNYTEYQFDSANRLIYKQNFDNEDTPYSETTLSFADIQGKLGYSIIDGVIKAESGYYDCYLLKDGGTVWKINNLSATLGDVTLTQIPGLSGITDISAGDDHVLALKSDGTVWAWGENTYGQLGNNSYTDSSTPVQVKNASNVPISGITKISAGRAHSLALKSDKTMLAWGGNAYGQLGNNSTTGSPVPVAVSTLTNVREIAASSRFNSYAIKEDNTAWAWGDNNYRQLGAGLTVASRSTPAQMTGMTTASKISASSNNAAILTTNNTVYTVGWNEYGQLGTGSTATYVANLTQVPGLTDIAHIGSSVATYFAMHSDGSVSTWGEYRGVALGTASIEYMNLPFKIPELNGIQSASGGRDWVLFKTSNNTCVYMNLGIYHSGSDKYTSIARFLTEDTANPDNFRHSMTLTNGDGYPSRYYYDKNNRLVGLEVTPDNSIFYLTKYAYDYAGNKTSETNARNYVTSYSYDDLRRLSQKTQPGSIITKYEYNAIDMLTKKTEPNNRITMYTYDEAGRLAWEKLGGSDIATKYFYKQYENYDRSGNILSFKQGYTTSGDVGRVLDAHTTYVYNNRNRLAGRYDLIEGINYRYSYYEYNLAGDKTLDKVFDGNNYIQTVYSYDSLRRNELTTTTAVYENQNVGTIKTGYEYDDNNNVIVKKDYTNANTYLNTEYDYNHVNQITEIREPVGEGNAVRVSKFDYDNRGNLTEKTFVLDNNDLTTSYVFDGMGNLSSETNALGKTKRYGYDAVGNRTIESDARFSGATLTAANGYRYSYDSLNRLTQTAVYTNGSSALLEYRTYDGRGNVTGIRLGTKTVLSKLVYDAANNLIAYTPADVAAKSSLNIGQEMTYNGLGNLLTLKQHYSISESYLTTYQYYGTGLLKAIIYPDSSIPESYFYDNTGRLYSEKTDRNTGVTRVWRTLFGTPWKTEYPDGTRETTDFDWYLGLALAYVDQKNRRREYKYDKNNKLIRERFNYDSTINQKYWKTVKYAYDDWGNLLTAEGFKTVTNTAGTTIISETSFGDRVTYNYDATFRNVCFYDETGREQIFEYNDAGYMKTHKIKMDTNAYDVKRYEYDPIGRIMKDITLVPAAQLYNVNAASDAEYTDRKQLVTSYTYTGMKVNSKITPNGTTSFVYDASYNITNVNMPNSKSCAYEYDFAGQVIRQTLSNNDETQYTYNYAGRVKQTKRKLPNNSFAIYEKKYDLMGNVISEANPYLYAANESYSYKYNIMNRRIASLDADDNILEVYAYDDAGNLIKKVNARNGAETVNINTFTGYAGDLSALAGDVFVYDSFDRVVSRTDALENMTAYEYDLRGNLTKFTDARANETNYFYNPDNTLHYVLYPDGGRIDYQYDRKGRKTSESVKQSNAVTITQSYTYTPFDTVSVVNDPYQNTIQSFYDGEGNAAKVIDKRGNAAEYQYDGNNRLVYKKIPIKAGVFQFTDYTYDAGDNVIIQNVSGTGYSGRSTHYNHTNGYLTSITNDEGQEIVYGYDYAGNVVSAKTLRKGSGLNKVFDETITEYDKYGRVESVINVFSPDEIELDGAANVTENGKVLSRAEYGYDTLGNRTSAKAPMAFANHANAAEYTTSYEYDELLRLKKAETTYKGIPVNTIYTYDAVGNRSSVKDAKDNVTSFEYDEMNRLKKMTDAKEIELFYKYDLAGNKTQEIRPSGTWKFEYDLLNRLSITRDPYNDVTSEIVYDANGNVKKKIDGRGYLSASTPETRYGTVYTYNLANMVETVTDAQSVSITNGYNAYGEKISVTDGLNNTTVYSYNSAGQLVSVTDPLENVTQYGYDKAGNRISVTDANGKITQYAYGSFGTLISITDALNRVQSYKYSLTGQKTEMVDRIGNTTNYSYNSLDLLTNMSVIEAGEVSATDSISFDYDCLGNRTEMGDSTGTYTYEYDELQRLESVSKNNAVQISYAYTDEGNIQTASYVNLTTTYTYYNNGRLHTVRNGGQGADYSYDKSGNIDEIVYVGGAKAKYTYYNNNAIHTVANKNSGNAAISSYTYTYDAAGRQASKTDSLGATAYGYDAAGNLETVTMPGKTSIYGYDDAGNRVSLTETYADPKTFKEEFVYVKKEVTYDYSDCNELKKTTENMYDSSNEFVVAKETRYEYDPNGNQYSTVSAFLTPISDPPEESNVIIEAVTDDKASYSSYTDLTMSEFDVWNRLKKRTVIKDTKQVITTFTYNGDGLRTSKTVRASEDNYAIHTTNYLYDGAYVVAEGNSSGTAAYIRGLNYIAKTGASNGVDYYMYNAHGDVVQVISGNGTVKNRYEYDPFGETILNVEETENSIMYSGEFYDASSGLYYLRARYYDPAIGRFISEDSFRGYSENPASLNLYSYCHNDPISFIDPTGHAPTAQERSDMVQSAYNAYKGGYISGAEYAAYASKTLGIVISDPSKKSSSSSSSTTKTSGGSVSYPKSGGVAETAVIQEISYAQGVDLGVARDMYNADVRSGSNKYGTDTIINTMLSAAYIKEEETAVYIFVSASTGSNILLTPSGELINIGKSLGMQDGYNLYDLNTVLNALYPSSLARTNQDGSLNVIDKKIGDDGTFYTWASNGVDGKSLRVKILDFNGELIGAAYNDATGRLATTVKLDMVDGNYAITMKQLMSLISYDDYYTGVTKDSNGIIKFNSGRNTYGVGDSGTIVLIMQDKLIASSWWQAAKAYYDYIGDPLEYDGTSGTGYFGKDTLKVLNFFKDYVLPGGNKGSNRGVFGPSTMEALNNPDNSFNTWMINNGYFNADGSAGPTIGQALDMSEHIYGDVKVGDSIKYGWTLQEVYTGPDELQLSLKMGIYWRVGMDGKIEYTVANKGTSTPGDWDDNGSQPFGFSDDLKYSVLKAESFVGQFAFPRVTFVGHSKGGAEAAANALKTNSNAILFNSAELNIYSNDLKDAVNKYQGTMRQYTVNGEVLRVGYDLSQIMKFGVISLHNIIGADTSPANRISLPSQSINPIENHSIGALRKALRQAGVIE